MTSSKTEIVDGVPFIGIGQKGHSIVKRGRWYNFVSGLSLSCCLGYISEASNSGVVAVVASGESRKMSPLLWVKDGGSDSVDVFLAKLFLSTSTKM